MIIYSFSFIALACVVLMLCIRRSRLDFSLFAITLTLAVAWFVTNRVSGDGLNLATVYFILSEKEGVGLLQFLPLIIAVIVYLIFLILMAFIPKIRCDRWFIARPLFYILIILGFIFNPIIRDVYHIYKVYVHDSSDSISGRQYYYVRSDNTPQKNLVLLYLESFERAYSDVSLFGEITPQLNKLRSQAIDISGVKTSKGQNWTVAGMVNSQCGTPLVPLYERKGITGDNNKMTQGFELFLPRAWCIGDILKAKGYTTVYLGGANVAFGNKGSFLKQHGFDTLKDLDYFKKVASEGDFSDWGVNDDVLLEELYREYVTLSQKSKPFFLAALTLGTHEPQGYIAKECAHLALPDRVENIQYLQAVYCSDHLVSQFIRKVMSSPYFKNTILVVTSDHTAFIHNDISSILQKAERDNNILIFGNDITPRVINRQATTQDTAATLVDLLGLDNQLGFGHSLLDDKYSDYSSEEEAIFAQASSLWKRQDASSVFSVRQTSYVIGGVEFSTEAGDKLILSSSFDVKDKIPWGDSVPPLSDGDFIIYFNKCAVMGIESTEKFCLWHSKISSNDGVVLEGINPGEYNLQELLSNKDSYSWRLSRVAEYRSIPLQYMVLKDAQLNAQKQQIVFENAKDIASYGPYIKLPKGKYIVRVQGVSSSPVKVRVTANAGKLLLGEVTVVPNNENHQIMLDQHISLKDDVELFEVVIVPEHGARGFISKIGIFPENQSEGVLH